MGQVRSYTRRTKSGKIITVSAHTRGGGSGKGKPHTIKNMRAAIKSAQPGPRRATKGSFGSVNGKRRSTANVLAREMIQQYKDWGVKIDRTSLRSAMHQGLNRSGAGHTPALSTKLPSNPNSRIGRSTSPSSKLKSTNSKSSIKAALKRNK